MTFYILDVFAKEKYAGNQLAVFLGGEELSTEEMQKIAKEINFSESTFILSGKQPDGGYDVRIFTPDKEVPFAGHPTLGTAYIIQKEIENSENQSVLLNVKAGTIPVELAEDELWMKQNKPTFGRFFEPEVLAEVLSIELDEIDTNFPIQEVSTGLPAIIVPLNSLESVKRSRVNKQKYEEHMKDVAANILVFSPETYHVENDLNARVFCDYFGITEDPATGSASGDLAGYLLEHNYLNKDQINISVEQGYEIKRPSSFYINAKKEGKDIHIEVGGNVKLVAKGEWEI